MITRFSAICFLAFNIAALPSANAAGDKWQLVWSDEFSGNSLDTAKWNFEEDCWGGGNNERQCYTSSERNVSVSNGTLKITALKQKTKGYAFPKSWREGTDGTLRGKKRFENT